MACCPALFSGSGPPGTCHKSVEAQIAVERFQIVVMADSVGLVESAIDGLAQMLNRFVLENQIEWIMECPGVTGQSDQLSNFGEIYFDSAMGGRGLDFLANAGADTVINMARNNVTVATATVETPTLLKSHTSATDKVIELAGMGPCFERA